MVQLVEATARERGPGRKEVARPVPARLDVANRRVERAAEEGLAWRGGHEANLHRGVVAWLPCGDGPRPRAAPARCRTGADVEREHQRVARSQQVAQRHERHVFRIEVDSPVRIHHAVPPQIRLVRNGAQAAVCVQRPRAVVGHKGARRTVVVPHVLNVAARETLLDAGGGVAQS
eukprot:2014029-Prymnesium_polylepis.2